MLSPEAEIESLRSTVARFFSVYGVVVSPMALTFQVGAPPGGIDAPFDALRIELVPKDYIPTVTQEKGETLVHVQRRPRPRFARTQVNLILLLVTVLTTTFFGGAWNWADYSGQPFLSAESLGLGGLFFTLPLLTILGSHEMGHYLVAKRYKVQASLPFFLPSVPPLGTFGAFISMRDPIPNRPQPVLSRVVPLWLPHLHPRCATSAAAQRPDTPRPASEAHRNRGRRDLDRDLRAAAVRDRRE